MWNLLKRIISAGLIMSLALIGATTASAEALSPSRATVNQVATASRSAATASTPCKHSQGSSFTYDQRSIREFYPGSFQMKSGTVCAIFTSKGRLALYHGKKLKWQTPVGAFVKFEKSGNINVWKKGGKKKAWSCNCGKGSNNLYEFSVFSLSKYNKKFLGAYWGRMGVGLYGRYYFWHN